MRFIFPALICLSIFSSCATLPSPTGRDLELGIRQHTFSTQRAIFLGDGVSAEAASRAAGASGAMVFYCEERMAGLRPGVFDRDVRASLRAMAASGDAWELAVAARARARFILVLSSMKPGELKSFRGKLALPSSFRNDQALQVQITRLFGEKAAIEYVDGGGR